ncbi:glycosyltransferase [Sphingobium sufflavum]|uniref:glycosyltransferase n=1 Tax=Sphingobium sufflavum TaxID=1129547 RepID=UPI001F2876D8|nr:glycosyltransferase [Sphingobium sufflavum]MCE7796794.1 glycosyltransferase [Sphingobium sufflavum]
MVETDPPDQPRRIAVLLPSLNGGGAERVALFLVDVLARSGYAVDLLVAVNEGSLVDHPIARQYRVDLRAPNEMLCGPHIVRYCRRARPDLLIAFVHTAKIMAGLARKWVPEIPLALSVHAALDIPRAHRFWVRRWFGHGPERWLYRDVLGCHVVSRALGEQVQAHFAIPADRTHLVYNPIPEREPPLPLPVEHEAWFDRPVVMTAGRMTRQKDHATLIRAFARSGLAGRARLLILGEGELEGRLRDLVQRLGLGDDVIFGGFQPDVRPYLARACGFALTSVFEGFAIVLTEALMAGVPVATFDCPSGPCEVLEGGKLGLLLQPGDVAGVADALRAMVAGELVAPPADQVAQSMERFSSPQIARDYLAFVEQCLGRGLARGPVHGPVQADAG